MQIENGKNNLIKLKNDLIEKLKKNIRIKKAGREYYEYEENKFYGLKDLKDETYLIKMKMMMIFMKQLNIYLMKVMLMN